MGDAERVFHWAEMRCSERPWTARMVDAFEIEVTDANGKHKAQDQGRH